MGGGMFRRAWWVVVLAVGIASCSGSRLPGANSGNRTTVYEAGVPNFDMEVRAVYRDGESGIDLHVSIPNASLVFTQLNDVYEAHFEVLVRVRARDGDAVVAERLWEDAIRTGDYDSTQHFERHVFQRSVDVPPGTYTVDVALEDLESGARAFRRQEVDLVEAAGGDLAVSAPLLHVQHAGESWRPFVAAHLAASYDSLRADLEVQRSATELVVDVQLLHFERDTSIAKAPFWFIPAHFSLARRGVQFANPEVVQRSQRRVPPRTEPATVTVSLPVLEEGYYRLLANIHTGTEATGQSRLVVHQRDFCVMPPSFPRIATLDAMIEALTYIARPDEMQHIRDGETVEERKRRFDAFWGKLVANRKAASALLKSYYSRVEEANVRFSSFKEGWKTDRGMVYIVMGMPLQIEEDIGQVIWRYTYGRGVPDFFFERVRALDPDGLFQNYVLQRDMGYERVWREAVERWRSGNVR